jgi:hypothetical protein
MAAVATVGCSDTVQATSACSNLEQAGGATRAEFVPCAGDMIAALDELAPLSNSALKGSKQARLDGESTLRQLLTTVSEAGGERLLERSNDRDLSDLRAEIHNAVSRYRHYYALAIPPEYHPMAARARQQAQWELDRAARHHDSARSLHRQLARR